MGRHRSSPHTAGPPAAGPPLGRHRPPRRGRAWLGALGVLTVAAVAVAGLVVAVRRHDSGGGAAQAALACGREARVVTAASFVPVLARLAPTLDRGSDCVRVRVDVADGRPAASQVADLGADVWIPDDAAWAATAPSGLLAGRGKAGSGTVLATSPVYMVADPPLAARVQKAGGSWLGLAELVGTAGSGVRLTVRDPAGSGDGLIGAGDLAESVWLADGMDASALTLAAALRATRTVTGTGPALPERPDEVGLVPEYALLPALARDDRLTVLAGTDHRALLRFSWLPTATAAGDPARAAALTRLLSALRGPDGAAAIDAAGLRRPDRGPPPTDRASRLPRSTAAPYEVLRGHHVDHVFAAWYPEDRRTSLLVVVDVSGSMAAPAPGTRTPLIETVRQGCRTVDGLLPDDSYLGLWEFGSRLDPPRDYRSVLPLRQLTGSHRAALTRAVAALAAQRTGTGLYDTILAAYRAATDAYRPGLPNQVLVFTDSRNEDDPDSITAAQLSAGLAAAAKPGRPVFLTVVSFGPESAVQPLRQAVQPVGGYVEAASTPAQVAAAFVHVAASGLGGY